MNFLRFTFLMTLALNTLPLLSMEKDAPKQRENSADQTAKSTASAAAGSNIDLAAAAVAAACSAGSAKAQSLDPDDELALKSRAGEKDGDAAATTISAAAGTAVASQPQKYTLELNNEFGNQKLEFDAQLIKLSAMLTDIANTNNKADAKNKSNVIPLPAEHIKISLRELHDVLSIISDPTKRPMYLTGKNIFDFCTAAHFLGIENLENIITEIFAKEYLNRRRSAEHDPYDFDKKLLDKYTHLPVAVQHSITSRIFNANHYANPLVGIMRPRELCKTEMPITHVSLSPDDKFVLISYKSDFSPHFEENFRNCDIRNAKDGRLITRYNARDVGLLEDSKLSPDGKKVASCYIPATNGRPFTIDIWDPKTGDLITSYAAPGRVNYLTWSRDSSKLATRFRRPDGTAEGANTNNCYVLDANNGKEVSRYIHDEDIALNFCNDIKFSNDGKFVATCYNDGTVHIWKTENGQCVSRYQIHTDRRNEFFRPPYALSLDWAPDDKRIASSSTYGSVYIFNVADGRIVTDCTASCMVSNSKDDDFQPPCHYVKFSNDGKYLAACVFYRHMKKPSCIQVCDSRDGTHKTHFLCDNSRSSLSWAHTSNALISCAGSSMCVLDIEDKPSCSCEELLDMSKEDISCILYTARVNRGSSLIFDTEETSSFNRLPRQIRDYILKQFDIS